MLTSYHVTENNQFFSVYSSREYDETKLGIIANGFNDISSDKDIDYALYDLKCVRSTALTFKCGDSDKIKIGDQIKVIGYPNFKKGDTYNYQQCRVSGRTSYMGSVFYVVDGRSVHGASGGVVLNDENEVVGIIKGGVATTEDEQTNIYQGFVPIKAVLEHIDSYKNEKSARSSGR